MQSDFILRSETGAGKSVSCNEVNIMNSFLFSATAEESIKDMILLFRSYVNISSADNAFRLLNRNAYEAMYYSALFNPLSAAALTEFCGFTCFMGTITVSDSLSQTISPTYYQLTNGSCSGQVFEITKWLEHTL